MVLVARNSIDAINLEDGSTAWGGKTIAMPSGADVCGHGCYAGGQYFVPLGPTAGPPYTGEGGGGEVMAVDLESGKVLATVKARPGSADSSAAAPGNLVCYRGRVISQGLDGLELYYQADAARDEAARRLAANPDDVEGLTLRGELLQDGGKTAEAVADFRRAYSLDKMSESHGRARALLRNALLAGLRDDFAKYRSMAGEIEPLLDGAGQRATYLRAMAIGLHRAGQWQQAVDHYLKLVDLDEAKPALEEVDRSHLCAAIAGSRLGWACCAAREAPRLPRHIDRVLPTRLEKAMHGGVPRVKVG